MIDSKTIIGPDKLMDVRAIPCSIKHGLILQTVRDLPSGEHVILFNGHDPAPLRYQLQAEFPGSFTWDYVERGDAGVKVKITKIK